MAKILFLLHCIHESWSNHSSIATVSIVHNSDECNRTGQCTFRMGLLILLRQLLLVLLLLVLFLWIKIIGVMTLLLLEYQNLQSS